MAATYTIVYASGTDGNPVWNAVGSNLMFRTDDTNDQDSNNPIKRKQSGLAYSYWKSIAIQWSGTYSEIKNIRLYCDGNIIWPYGTNGALYVGDETLSDSQYEQATGTIGEDGDEMVANHSGITGKTNIENYTISSPKVVDSSTYTTDGTSKHVVLQLAVDSDAQVGLFPSETLYFVVDEL